VAAGVVVVITSAVVVVVVEVVASGFLNPASEVPEGLSPDESDVKREQSPCVVNPGTPLLI
jgi:hypothetical protein